MLIVQKSKVLDEMKPLGEAAQRKRLHRIQDSSR